MTVKDLLTSGIEVQSEIHICYYDELKDDTISLTELEALDKTIAFMYIDIAKTYPMRA